MRDDSEEGSRRKMKQHLPTRNEPILILPIFEGEESNGHFSVVVREVTENGGFMCSHMDTHTSEKGQIRSKFTQCEHLWNSRSTWRTTSVTKQSKGSQDCGPLTCLNAYAYVMTHYRTPALLKAENRRIEIVATRDANAFGQTARKWLHKTITNDGIPEDFNLLKWVAVRAVDSTGKEIKVTEKKKRKRKRKKTKNLRKE